jgi:hypothetical protein
MSHDIHLRNWVLHNSSRITISFTSYNSHNSQYTRITDTPNTRIPNKNAFIRYYSTHNYRPVQSNAPQGSIFNPCEVMTEAKHARCVRRMNLMHMTFVFHSHDMHISNTPPLIQCDVGVFLPRLALILYGACVIHR